MDCGSPAVNLSAANFAARVGSHILAVEDDAGNAATLKAILEFLGHSVRLAADASEAVRLAQSERFELVVSDIGLPGMDGFELMRELRERYALPGIALTGLEGTEESDRCRSAGFSEHIVKPIEIADLEAAIQRVLGTRI